MAKVKNLTNVAVSLVLKDGTAVSVNKKGEPQSVDFDPDNEHNKQMIAMRAIEVLEGSAAARSRPTKKAAPKKAASKKPAPKKAAPRKPKAPASPAKEEIQASDEPQD